MTVSIYIGHKRASGEPIEFPVEWPSEDAAAITWQWDSEHGGLPVTPLSVEFGGAGPGQAAAAKALGFQPFIGRVFVHGFDYAGGGTNSWSGLRLEAASLPSAAFKKLRELGPQVAQHWEGTWRVQIEAEAVSIRDDDYETVTIPGLVERLDELLQACLRRDDFYFRTSLVGRFNLSRLVAFCSEHLNHEPEDLVNRLLQGTPNVSLDASAALWEIAQEVKANPRLFELLQRASSAGTLDGVEQVPGGREFQIAFRDWLDRYGRRNGGFGELSEPTWCERPAAAVAALLNYPDANTPRLAQTQLESKRKELVLELEAELGVLEKVAQFRELLESALPYPGLRESRSFSRNMHFAALRVPILALGRKLVATGQLHQADDIFFLTLADVRAGATNKSLNFESRVTELRRDYERWRDVVPPAEIGGGVIPEANRPQTRNAEMEASAGQTLKGVAASPGIVRARARVIMTLAEAEKLTKGEILVTRSTMPMWTPLFAVAGAVVTDGGGILSHCAIVAREFGLPAVVGAAGATGRIRDGMTITVDGTTGLVTLEDLI